MDKLASVASRVRQIRIVRTAVNDINIAKPHEYDHTHSTSAGSGWLRASVFGAMDGLVSNIGLITGIAAAGASPGIVVLTGVSGLISGGISMALGEYTSVRTQNEQLDAEVRTERAALRRNPVGEQAELAEMFQELGMESETARAAASQVHSDHEQALKVHLAHELGLTPDDRPSPYVAGASSFVSYSVGALIPLLPYFFGLHSIWWGLAFGGAGLLFVGFIAAKFTSSNPFAGAGRQLLFGAIAVAATFAIGRMLGVDAVG